LAKENMYGDGGGKIFRILGTLQESLILAPIITVVILFCNLKMWNFPRISAHKT